MASIVGRWRLNDRISYSLQARIPINFVSNGFRYYYMNIGYNANALSFVYAPYSEDNNIMVDVNYGHVLYSSGYMNNSEPFREVDFGTVGQPMSADFFSWITENATYVGESIWEPVYQASVASGKWELREAYKYIGSSWKKISSLFRTYAVAASTTGIDVSIHQLNGNIAEDGIAEFYLTATDGGQPSASRLHVTNAEVVAWENLTDKVKLTIGSPTGPVTISASI